MMGYGYGYPGIGYGMMGLGMLIPLILIILIVVFAVKYINAGKNGRSYNGENKALDILNERYARGEISEEEYTRRKTMLKK